MDTDKFKETFLFGKYSNLNPIKPLLLWGNTNYELDKFYDLPEINITNNPWGLSMKNSMRHIVGPAIITQEYTPDYARLLGAIKEGADFTMGKDLNDSFIDYRNNNKGINYAIANPNASRKQIMQYAYEQALKDNPKNLYDYLIEP